ncbi:MAG: hypothetical protein K2F91_00430 [Muribaculaceae bacterium]|nr:hypothetical protein [Muribaculaceae bacterium]
MAELNENRRVFRCNYTDAPLFDRISVWGLCIGVAVVLVLSISNITPVTIFALLYMFIPLWFEFGIYMVRTRSSLELTDGEMNQFAKALSDKSGRPVGLLSLKK